MDSNHSANSGGSGEGTEVTGKRKRIGGRGREWLTMCYKLLEQMFELEDSKPFQNPVDILKYPRYNHDVKNHMDLSKVKMNLHNGMYSTPEAFADDIRLIFKNWKLHIKDNKDKIFTQIHHLSWWFEQEFSSIKSEWDRGQSAKRIRAPNSPVHVASPSPPQMVSNTNRQSLELLRMLQEQQMNQQTPSMAQAPATEATPNSAQPTQNTNIVVSIKNGNCTIFSRDREGASEDNPAAAASRSDMGLTPSQRLEADPGFPKLEMSMEVTNIWFGPHRSKPQKHITLSEDGIYINLRSQNEDIPFFIWNSEIVRALGHLSQSRKHTLFLFVTPKCEKRLKDLATEKILFGNKSQADPCSLIAIFIKALPQPLVSKLIHIFWVMGRTSLFGQLFSEVDQKGALSILANIKPQILDRLATRIRESTDDDDERTRLGLARPQHPASTASASSDAASRSEPSTSTLPVPNNLPVTLSYVAPNRTSATQNGLPASRKNALAARQNDDTEIVITGDSDDEDLAIVTDDFKKDSSLCEVVASPSTAKEKDSDLVVTSRRVSTKCPITQQTMQWPMRNKFCGHVYDKNGVEQLIINRQSKARCPVPGCSNQEPLKMAEMNYDYELRRIIMQQVAESDSKSQQNKGSS